MEALYFLLQRQIFHQLDIELRPFFKEREHGFRSIEQDFTTTPENASPGNELSSDTPETEVKDIRSAQTPQAQPQKSVNTQWAHRHKYRPAVQVGSDHPFEQLQTGRKASRHSLYKRAKTSLYQSTRKGVTTHGHGDCFGASEYK